MIEILREKLGLKDGQSFSKQGRIFKFDGEDLLEYINGSWNFCYNIPSSLIYYPSPEHITVPPDWQEYYKEYYRPKTWKERLIKWLKN